MRIDKEISDRKVWENKRRANKLQVKFELKNLESGIDKQRQTLGKWMIMKMFNIYWEA